LVPVQANQERVNRLFARILEDKKNAIWAIPAPEGGSRAFCDRMNSWAQGEGQPGLGYVFWREGEEGGAGPIAKNIGAERTEAVRAQLGLKVGDAAFFVAGDPKTFYKFAGSARTKVGTARIWSSAANRGFSNRSTTWMLLAGAVGVVFANLLTRVLLHRLEVAFNIDWKATAIALVATAVLATATGWIASYRILGLRPLQVLREE